MNRTYRLTRIQSGYLSVSQAAKLLSVATDTVRKAIDEGRLPAALGPGDLTVIRVADVEAYRQRTQPDGVKHNGRPRQNRQATKGQAA